MKKFTFRNLLSFSLALLMLVSAVLFNASFATASTVSVPDCDCGNNGALEAHTDSCARKTYCKTLASENTAEELYTMWSELPEDITTFVLTYLGWTDQTKKSALEALIADQSDGVQIETTIGDVTIGAEGDFSEDISVSASALDEESILQYTNVVNDLAPEIDVLAAYDIKLMQNSSVYQPESAVHLSLSGINTYDYENIVIYHFLDTKSAIDTAIANGTAVKYQSSGISDSFPTETQAAYAAVNEEDTVYYEVIDASAADGTVDFYVSSFSIYVVASGNTTTGYDLAYKAFIMNTSNTYYVMPNTTITLYSSNTTATNNVLTLGSNANWNITNDNIILVSQNSTPYTGKSFTFEIPYNAKSGSTATITQTRSGTTTTAKIVVQTKEQIVSKALVYDEAENYEVYLTCITDPQNGLPGEPGVNTRKFSIIRSDYTIHKNSGNTGWTAFSKNGNPSTIIKSDIYNVLKTNYDGSNTLGLVDTSGIITKEYLQNIDWDKALYNLAVTGSNAKNGATYATNGEKLTSSNYTQYQLIPYVVKLQTGSGLTWNIDCYVVPKSNAVSLRYDFNIPDGWVLQGNYAVPATKTGATTFTATVDDVFTFESTYTMKSTEGYTLLYEFKGWESDVDKKIYKQNTSITVSQNTVLYAQWEPVYTSLTVKKSGTDVIDENQSFIFHVIGYNNVDVTVTVHGNSSVTIDGLVVGGVYTVTEMTDWSWRYDFIEAEKSGTGITNFSYVKKTATATGTLGKSGNEITFTNSRSETVWLDGDSWCDNLFK